MPDLQQPNTSEITKTPLLNPCFVVVTLAIVVMGFLLERPHAKAVFSQARIFFAGPDDYMRTYRARQIADGHAVRIRYMTEINAPAGAALHWTAPMDYLLAGAVILLGRFADHADPFGYVAAWVPACLGAIYVVCMIGLMRRGFGWGPAVLAGLMVVLSPAFHRVFQVGHPDHHCLLELLLLVALGAWVPNARPDGTPGAPTTAAAIVSGLATGLAIWVAAQAVFLWLALIVGLAYACLSGPHRARQMYADARSVWNCTTALVVVVGFLVENWPDLNVVTVDKISAIHLALVAIGFLAPTRVGLSTTPAKRRSAEQAPVKDETPPHLQAQTTRHIALLAAIAAFGVWMTIDHSRAFEYVSRSEFFRWSEHIAELQPLYTHTPTDWSIRPMHERVGLLPYALPLLVVFFVRSKQVPRPVKCTLGLLAPVIMILAIAQLRWVDHFNLAITPVAVVGMWELVKALTSTPRLWHRHPACGSTAETAVPQSSGDKPLSDKTASREGATGGLSASEHGQASWPWHAHFLLAAAALAVLVYPSARSVVSITAEDARLANAYQERTDFVAQQISAYGIAHPPLKPSRRAILCEDGEGPMLLYCTGLPVIATPYHRALDGLVEAARFYAERDPLKAREQLDRLGVRYVVMPPRAHEQLMHFETIAFGELRSFNPPTETINRFGRIMQTLNYKPEEVSQTMAYRLVMQPDGEVIPGVKRIAEIQEGATTADGRPMKTGLLYVVEDVPSYGVRSQETEWSGHRRQAYGRPHPGMSGAIPCRRNRGPS